MESLISGDIFKYIIAQKLPNRDLFNLSKSLENGQTLYPEKILDVIKFKTILEIEKRLANEFSSWWRNDSERLDIYAQFKALLKKTGSVISGSIILQCMLDEYWENSDIDIFVPMTGNEISKTKNDNVMSEVDDFLFSTSNFTNYIAPDRYESDVDNKIRFIRTFESSRDRKYNLQTKSEDRSQRDYNIQTKSEDRSQRDYNLQVILVEVSKEELPNFIRQNFDFDICKNILNFGDNFIKTEERLDVYTFSEILTRNTKFKVGNRIGSTVERCQRYEKRGFYFSDKNLSIATLKELMELRNINNVSELDSCIRTNCPVRCPIRFCRPDVTHYHCIGQPICGGHEDDIFIDSLYD